MLESKKLGSGLAWTMVVSVVVLWPLCGATGAATEIPELSVPVCKEPPAIDGQLDDACWRAAVMVDNLHIVLEPGEMTRKHKVYVTRDSEWLYAAFDAALPASDRMPAQWFKHDQLVQREDNVQLSFDPGTDGALYYQFLVNKANTRADFRMTSEKGRERENWNIPWRSATHLTDAGWQVEIAIPFCLLTAHGDLAQARLNLIVTSFIPTRDAQSVQTGQKREKTSWSPLLRSFHEPDRFGRLLGLAGAEFKAPPLPFFTNARASAYEVDAGAYRYELIADLRAWSSRPSKLRFTATDRPVAGPSTQARLDLTLAGDTQRELRVRVPVSSLCGRTAVLSMADATTGEVLQTAVIDDTAALDLFYVFLDRNYYTSEPVAVAVCRIGLPEEAMRSMSLRARDEQGRVLGREERLKPVTHLQIPIAGSAAGSHTITIELCSEADQVASRQAVELVKRPAGPGSEWKVDRANHVLLKDGEPFFPYGFIMTKMRAAEEWAFRDVAEAGFTSIFQWYRGGDPETDAQAFLEATGRYGLNVIMWPDQAYTVFNDDTKLKDPGGILTPEQLQLGNKKLKSYGGGMTTMKGLLVSHSPFKSLAIKDRQALLAEYFHSNLPRLLTGIRHAQAYPNLIGFNLFDEPLILETMMYLQGRELYQAIHDIDGYHPAFLLYSSEIPETDKATDWCDVLGTDPYWIPAGNYRNTVNWVSKVVATTKRRADEVHKVAYTVPMAEYYSGTYKRALHPREQRCQTYLALIHGSKGIFYYYYPVLTQVNWDCLKQLAGEMKTLGPLAVTPDVPQTVSYTPGVLDPENDRFTDVQVSLRRAADGGFVLLAANTKHYPVDVTLKLSNLDEASTVGRLFSDDKVTVTGGAIAERFEPFGTRTYAYRAQASVAGPVEIAVDMKALTDQAQTEPQAYSALGRVKQKNLIPNPSFEDATVRAWPDYFKYTGTKLLPHERIGAPGGVWGTVSEKPFHGQSCLRMAAGGADKHRITYGDIQTRTDHPSEYTFSVYLRADRDGVKVNARGLPEADAPVTLTTAWQRFVWTFTRPAGESSLRFQIYLRGDWPGQSDSVVWLDAVQLERGAEASAFVASKEL